MRLWLRLDMPPEEATSLRERHPEIDFVGGGEEDVPDDLDGVEAIFTRQPVPDETVRRMGGLRWVHLNHGGAAGYLTPAIMERSIDVTTSTGTAAVPFAEFAMACILTLANRLPACWQAQQEQRWDESLTPQEIGGKTLLVIGLGAVGSELARKAKAFDMRVAAIKRHVGEVPDYVDELAGPDALLDLLPRSDYVVLCLPSVEKDVMGERELTAMKPGSYLINMTGRQSIPDEAALVRALTDGPIAGAVLNTFAGGGRELAANSPLWRLPNVVITPRTAGPSGPQWRRVIPLFEDNLARFLAGTPMRNVVDKVLGYARPGP